MQIQHFINKTTVKYCRLAILGVCGIILHVLHNSTLKAYG